MTQTVQKLRTFLTTWFGQDRYRASILAGGFAYAWFFSQGIPLWDEDFATWFARIQGQGLPSLIWQWISPLASNPQFWGFNERPLQMIVYKLCFLVSGYEAWSYFLVKSAVYGGLGLAIYAWGTRLLPESVRGTVLGRRAALAAAILFLVSPGPLAAHVIHYDWAPLAELIFLALTYWLWDFVERTPAEWRGFAKLSDPAQKAWLKRAAVLSICVYLGYKSKADLKLIPLIFAIYVAITRRAQWKLFLAPIGLMLALSVPWSMEIFRRLPPFLPGTSGGGIGWIWQPASFSRMWAFIWSETPYSFFGSFQSSTISLAGLWGPFLLAAMGAFLAWRARERRCLAPGSSATDRARVFALIWFAVILLATSSLPEINYSFRIRYGILPLVPGSLLLAWVFGLFAQSMAGGFAGGLWPVPARFHRAVVGVAIGALALQATINLSRSVNYRRTIGQVMVAVDQAYASVQATAPEGKLALLPDFRPYDYRPGAGKAFAEKSWLGSSNELARMPAGQTLVLSWSPSLWEQLELVTHVSGCRSHVLFDLLYPCPAGTGAFVMRYLGQEPLYAQAEAARARGDVAGAWKLHNEFLQKRPGSLASKFMIALLAFQQKDFARADQEFGEIERVMPAHFSIVYNRALAQAELKQYDQAIARLQRVIAADEKSYGAWINLYWTQTKAGYTKKATRSLQRMKAIFPDNAEVDRLLAASASK